MILREELERCTQTAAAHGTTRATNCQSNEAPPSAGVKVSAAAFWEMCRIGGGENYDSRAAPRPGSACALFTGGTRRVDGSRACRTCESCPGRMAAFVRRIISTTKAPGAIGPYSQAVVMDRTMYISGQLGMDPTTGQLVNGGATQETKQALINMGEILKAANCDYNNVVKTTVLLADINDFNCVNEVYMQYFKTNFPARAAYQVAALPRGGRVEIEAVAVLGPIMDGPLDQKL